MLSRQLDIDMHLSALPQWRAATGIPVLPIATVEAYCQCPDGQAQLTYQRCVNAPRQDCGLPIGTSAHYVLASIVATHFGKSIRRWASNYEHAGARGDQGAGRHRRRTVGVPCASLAELGLAELLVDANGYAGRATSRRAYVYLK
jgi:hypothetical protein